MTKLLNSVVKCSQNYLKILGRLNAQGWGIGIVLRVFHNTVDVINLPYRDYGGDLIIKKEANQELKIQ